MKRTCAVLMLLALAGCTSSSPTVAASPTTSTAASTPTPSSSSVTPTPSPTTTTAAPSPTVTTHPAAPAPVLKISEATACQQAFPVLEAVQKEIGAFIAHPDGTANKTATLRGLRNDLDHLIRVAPSDMTATLQAIRSPVETLIRVLDTRVNATMDMQDYQSAGLDFINRCSAYVVN